MRSLILYVSACGRCSITYTIKSITMTLDDLHGGLSPVSDFVGDPFRLEYGTFIAIFDWVLFNNGLVIIENVNLN